MSKLKEKVAEAAKYVVIDGKPVKNPKKAEKLILDKLAILGIFDDEVSMELLESDDMKEGDARKIFCETEPIMPVPRFRRVWTILHGEEKEERVIDVFEEGIKRLTGSKSFTYPVGQMSTKDLLQDYEGFRSSDEHCDDRVEEELLKRSKGKRVIVFNKDKTINISLSASLFSKARVGREIPEAYRDKHGAIHFPKKVGELPEEYYDICPITGDVLFEGYSSSIDFSFASLNHEQRQAIWALRTANELSSDNISLRNFLISLELKDSSSEEILLISSKALSLYQDLKETGELPSLKKKISSTSQLKKNSDPFNIGNKKY